MQGYDPRALTDAVVRDPFDPTDTRGTSLNTSWQERSLISAVLTGDLLSAPANVIKPNRDTNISVVSLVPWLRARGHVDLAGELDITPQPHGTAHPPSATAQPMARVPEPERRLIALRALGGEAKWMGRNGGMRWRFTKIKELTEQEKRTKQPRCDEKTIRKDLKEAAEAENMAKRSGATP